MKKLLPLILIWTAKFVVAEDWTRFRGPEGTGVTRQIDVPTNWDASMVVWKVDLPGQGQSSPVHWDGKLFLTVATEGGKVRHTLCIDKASGKTLWKQSVPSNSPEDVHKMNSARHPLLRNRRRSGHFLLRFGGTALLRSRRQEALVSHRPRKFSRRLGYRRIPHPTR